jgi:hypothetical protein
MAMPLGENAKSLDAVRRKLRALTAVLLDPASTEPEKANAERLKAHLETQLPPEAVPQAGWTNIMFRLGRGVKAMTSPPPRKGDWTDHAYQLGRMLRRSFKK